MPVVGAQFIAVEAVCASYIQRVIIRPVEEIQFGDRRQVKVDGIGHPGGFGARRGLFNGLGNEVNRIYLPAQTPKEERSPAQPTAEIKRSPHRQRRHRLHDFGRWLRLIPGH